MEVAWKENGNRMYYEEQIEEVPAPTMAPIIRDIWASTTGLGSGPLSASQVLDSLDGLYAKARARYFHDKLSVARSESARTVAVRHEPLTSDKPLYPVKEINRFKEMSVNKVDGGFSYLPKVTCKDGRYFCGKSPLPHLEQLDWSGKQVVETNWEHFRCAPPSLYNLALDVVGSQAENQCSERTATYHGGTRLVSVNRIQIVHDPNPDYIESKPEIGNDPLDMPWYERGRSNSIGELMAPRIFKIEELYALEKAMRDTRRRITVEKPNWMGTFWGPPTEEVIEEDDNVLLARLGVVQQVDRDYYLEALNIVERRKTGFPWVPLNYGHVAGQLCPCGDQAEVLGDNIRSFPDPRCLLNAGAVIVPTVGDSFGEQLLPITQEKVIAIQQRYIFHEAVQAVWDTQSPPEGMLFSPYQQMQPNAWPTFEAKWNSLQDSDVVQAYYSCFRYPENGCVRSSIKRLERGLQVLTLEDPWKFLELESMQYGFARAPIVYQTLYGDKHKRSTWTDEEILRLRHSTYMRLHTFHYSDWDHLREDRKLVWNFLEHKIKRKDRKNKKRGRGGFDKVKTTVTVEELLQASYQAVEDRHDESIRRWNRKRDWERAGLSFQSVGMMLSPAQRARAIDWAQHWGLPDAQDMPPLDDSFESIPPPNEDLQDFGDFHGRFGGWSDEEDDGQVHMQMFNSARRAVNTISDINTEGVNSLINDIGTLTQNLTRLTEKVDDGFDKAVEYMEKAVSAMGTSETIYRGLNFLLDFAMLIRDIAREDMAQVLRFAARLPGYMIDCCRAFGTASAEIDKLWQYLGSVFRFSPKESNEGNVEMQSETTEFSLLAPLAATILTLVGGRFPKESTLSAMMISMRSYVPAKTAAIDLIKVLKELPRMLPECVKDAILHVCPWAPVAKLLTSKEIAEWMQEVVDIENKWAVTWNDTWLDQGFPERVDKAMTFAQRTLLEMGKHAPSGNPNFKSLGVFNSFYQRLQTIANAVHRDAVAPSARKEPYCVGLVGKPGTGKSRIAQYVVAALAPPGTAPTKLSYAMNGAMKHWDGYQGQFAVLIDDLATCAKYTQDSDAAIFQQIVSSANVLLPMANLIDKGKRFVSDVVVANSNVTTFTKKPGASGYHLQDHFCPAALDRRRHTLVNVSVPKEYQKSEQDEAVDPEKVRQKRGVLYDPSILIFTELNAGTGLPTGNVWNLTQFLTVCRQEYKARKEQNREYTERLAAASTAIQTATEEIPIEDLVRIMTELPAPSEEGRVQMQMMCDDPTKPSPQAWQTYLGLQAHSRAAWRLGRQQLDEEAQALREEWDWKQRHRPHLEDAQFTAGQDAVSLTRSDSYHSLDEGETFLSKRFKELSKNIDRTHQHLIDVQDHIEMEYGHKIELGEQKLHEFFSGEWWKDEAKKWWEKAKSHKKIIAGITAGVGILGLLITIYKLSKTNRNEAQEEEISEARMEAAGRYGKKGAKRGARMGHRARRTHARRCQASSDPDPWSAGDENSHAAARVARIAERSRTAKTRGAAFIHADATRMESSPLQKQNYEDGDGWETDDGGESQASDIQDATAPLLKIVKFRTTTNGKGATKMDGVMVLTDEYMEKDTTDWRQIREEATEQFPEEARDGRFYLFTVKRGRRANWAWTENLYFHKRKQLQTVASHYGFEGTIYGFAKNDKTSFRFLQLKFEEMLREQYPARMQMMDGEAMNAREKIRDHMAVVSRANAPLGRYDSIVGIWIAGNMIMVPRHLFHYEGSLKDGEVSGNITIQMARGQTKYTLPQSTYSIQSKDVYIPRYANGELMDVCFISVKGAPSFPSIVKKWQKESEVTRTEDGVFIPGYNTGAKSVDNKWENYSTYCWNLEFPVEYEDERYNLLEGYMYTADTVPGVCGSPVMLTKSNTDRRFVGIHVAARDRVGFANAVTQEMLQQALEKLGVIGQQGQQIPKGLVNAEGCCYLKPKGSLAIIGEANKEYRKWMPCHTKIRRTCFQGVLGEPTKDTPVFTRHDPRLEIDIDPLVQGIEKYGKETVALDAEDLDAVVDYMIETTVSTMRQEESKAGRIPRLLSEDEAINGVEGFDQALPIRMKTSAGFPLSLRPGVKGRKDFFTEREDGSFYVSDKELRVLIDRTKSRAENGEHSECVFIDSLKDEKLALRKIKIGKTRIFSMGPLQRLIVERMYNGWFNAAYVTHFMKLKHTVGINCYSTEWSEMALKLTEVGNYGFSGDFKKWDGTLRPELMYHLSSIITAFYGDEYLVPRQALRQDVFCAVHLAGGTIYQALQGNPSGCTDTIILNSLAHEALLLYAIYKLAPPEYKSFLVLNEKVRFRVNGDDNIIFVAPELHQYINLPAMAKLYAQHGLEYLDPNAKEGEEFRFRPIEELEYLKNGFRKINGITWYATLDEDTIREMPLWRKSGVPEETALFQNSMLALHRMFFYGGGRFKEFRDEILAAQSKVGVHFNLPTYKELERDYKTHGELQIETAIQGAVNQTRRKPYITPGIRARMQMAGTYAGAAATLNVEGTVTNDPAPLVQGQSALGKIKVKDITGQADKQWSLQSMVRSLRIFDQLAFSPDQAQGDIIKAWTLPWDLIKNRMFKAQFENLTYWRGNIQIKCSIAATPFVGGRLCLVYVPLTKVSQLVNPDNPDQLDQFWPLARITQQFACEYIDLATSSGAELEVIYSHPWDFMALNRAPDGPNALPCDELNFMGTLMLIVMNPLINPDSCNPNIEILMEASFESSGYPVMPVNTPNIFTTETPKARVFRLRRELELAQAAAGVTGARMEMLSAVKSFAEKKLLPAFFSNDGEQFDHPNDSMVVDMTVARKPWGTTANGKAVQRMERAAIDPAVVMTRGCLGLENVGNYENDLAKLRSIPTFYGQIEWLPSAVRGDILTINGKQNLELNPIATLRNRTVDDAPDVLYPTTPLEFFSFPFSYWQGGLKIMIQLVAPKFVKGKLAIAPHYGVYGTTPPSDLIDATTPFNFQLDLADTTRDFIFNLQYLREISRCLIYDGPSTGEVEPGQNSFPFTALGYLNFVVVNPLSVSCSTGEKVIINVFIAAGDNYCPSVLAGNNQSLAPSNIWWRHDTSETVNQPRTMKPRPPPTARAEMIIENSSMKQENAMLDAGPSEAELGTVETKDSGPMDTAGMAEETPLPNQEERLETQGETLGPVPPKSNRDVLARYDGGFLDQIKRFSPLVTVVPTYSSANLGDFTIYGANQKCIDPGFATYMFPVAPPVNLANYELATIPPGQAGLAGYFGSAFATWMGDIRYRVLMRLPVESSLPAANADVGFNPPPRNRHRLYAFYLANFYEDRSDDNANYRDLQAIGAFLSDQLRLTDGTTYLKQEEQANYGITRPFNIAGRKDPDDPNNKYRGVGQQMAGARCAWWVCDETAPYLEIEIPYNGLTNKKMNPVNTLPIYTDSQGFVKMRKHWTDVTMKNFFYMGQIIFAYVSLDKTPVDNETPTGRSSANDTPKLEIQIGLGDNFRYMDYVGTPPVIVRHSYAPGDLGQTSDWNVIAPDSYEWTPSS